MEDGSKLSQKEAHSGKKAGQELTTTGAQESSQTEAQKASQDAKRKRKSSQNEGKKLSVPSKPGS